VVERDPAGDEIQDEGEQGDHGISYRASPDWLWLAEIRPAMSSRTRAKSVIMAFPPED
jgi:hypothetical protein